MPTGKEFKWSKFKLGGGKIREHITLMMWGENGRKRVSVFPLKAF